MDEKQRNQRFLMLIGLPASGKSTVAEGLMEDREDIIYLSSDLIRLELFGDESIQQNNGEVFNQMAIRTREALKNGKHVIYDATNISRKKRKGLLQQIPKDVEKIACYISTDYKKVIEQNENRERKVPQHVIDNMYKSMQVPIYSEGWDDVMLLHHDETTANQMPEQFTKAFNMGVLLGREGYMLISELASYFDEFFGIYDLPQDSKYHSLSVSRHIYYVYRHVLDNYKSWNEEDKMVMLWAALLHDVGKAFSKSFINRRGEETRYANFIGHENVGSQMAVQFLHRMNYGDEFIHKVATLVQFHMYLLDEKASKEKLRSAVGEDMYAKLEFLRDADTLAH